MASSIAFMARAVLIVVVAIATAAAVGLALALRLQQPLLSLSARGPSSALVPDTGRTATYCYEGVRASAKGSNNDPSSSRARCFSVTADGLIARVWQDPDEALLAAADDAVDDAATRTAGHIVVSSDGFAIPGLWDGHGHLAQYGELLDSVDLFGAQSVDEALARVKAYLAENPGAGSSDNWLRGVGWDQNAYGRMPTAADFDAHEHLRGLYIMLDRIDIHCTWVSPAVLRLLPPAVPDVPGGEVVRDPGPGVFCDNAMDLVLPHWPAPSPRKKAAQVAAAMARLNEVGIVGIHDAGQHPSQTRLYAALADDHPDAWSVRVYGMILCDDKNTVQCLDDARSIRRDDHRLVVRSVKLFADGALGSWGSALLEPYTDRPETSGSLLINASALADVATAWAARGFQVNIHGIGDLANRNIIDALEAALRHVCPAGEDLSACQARRRFRVEHAQVIHPLDQLRMRDLGLIPSIQPTHATSDMAYAERRLGARRTALEAYRMRSLLRLGLDPVLGSDFPVEPPNPFHGIYAALTRRSPRTGLGPDPDNPRDGWHVQEALTLDQALWGFTGAAAHGAFLEGKAGVLREGAFADWVVLDEPLEGMDVERLRDLRVRETWVGGKRVYAREDAAATRAASTTSTTCSATAVSRKDL